MTDTLTHAITERQPRAWVAAAGYCPVLMSNTRPPMEREGQLIGIHASTRTWTVEEWRTHFDRLVAMKLSPPTVYPRGALLGVARLVGVLRERIVLDSGEKFFELLRGRAAGLGPRLDETTARRVRRWWPKLANYGLLLTDAVLLPEPIPMRGAGGAWRIPTTFPPNAKPAGFAGAASYVSADEWALEQWRTARGA